MWQVDYYKRPNGHEPAKDWIYKRENNSIRHTIHARIDRLKERGLSLRDNKILEPIRERPGGKIVTNFFELRHTGKIKWRLPVYYNQKENIFVLISEGWRKSQRIHKQYIDRALRLLAEYLSEEGGKDAYNTNQ